MSDEEILNLWDCNKLTCGEVIELARADERAKVLDDLVRMVCEYYTIQERAGFCADTNNMIKQRITDFAEQLKEQK